MLIYFLDLAIETKRHAIMVQTERELRKTNLPKILMLLRSQSDLRGAACGSEELLAGGELLGDHACRGEHGEAAVVQLLVLHLEELGRALRLEAEWVEPKVARLVVRTDRPRLAADGRLEGEDGEDLVGVRVG